MLFLSLLLLSCAQTPVREAVSNNPNVPVAMLFEHEGCTVYRFFDNGRYHYFARCGDGGTSTSSQRSCGKNCVRDEEIRTETVP